MRNNNRKSSGKSKKYYSQKKSKKPFIIVLLIIILFGAVYAYQKFGTAETAHKTTLEKFARERTPASFQMIDFSEKKSKRQKEDIRKTLLNQTDQFNSLIFNMNKKTHDYTKKATGMFDSEIKDRTNVDVYEVRYRQSRKAYQESSYKKFVPYTMNISDTGNSVTINGLTYIKYSDEHIRKGSYAVQTRIVYHKNSKNEWKIKNFNYTNIYTDSVKAYIENNGMTLTYSGDRVGFFRLMSKSY